MIDGLTNLERSFAAAGRCRLDEFAPGSAFSTVYNPTTGQFLAYASGESRLLSGVEPLDLVSRRGGHGTVNKQFSEMTGIEPTSNVAFTVFLEEDGALSIEWRSGSVNGANQSFPGVLVPDGFRSQIINDIEKAAGRKVKSR